jgi:hypothetical protein
MTVTFGQQKTGRQVTFFLTRFGKNRISFAPS